MSRSILKSPMIWTSLSPETTISNVELITDNFDRFPNMIAQTDWNFVNSWDELLNLRLSFHFDADEVAILAWHKFNWMRFSWWQFPFGVSAILIFDMSSVTFCSLFFNSSISLHKSWFCFRKHTYMACTKENPRGMNWELRDKLISRTRGGGADTAIYEFYRYVPLWRVWFSSSLL